MLARFAARLFMAPLGFVCGLLAGFAALAVMSMNKFGDVTLFPTEVMLLGVDMTVGAWTVLFVLGPLIAAPAIVAVLIAEMFAIRAWTYYAVAGAVTAVLPWSLLPSGVDGALFETIDILACGFVGGLTHWLVAGRGAGFMTPENPPPQDRPTP